jgi:hypothetical protein
MIGIVADPGQQDVVREFFELFKTPWEFFRRGRHYDVLLCTDGVDPLGAAADLTLVYAGGRTSVDDATGIDVVSQQTGAVLAWGGQSLPIYGPSLTFKGKGYGRLTEPSSGEAAACALPAGRRTLARVGYDLFREVRTLLTEGQPVAHAGVPTLDLHIALLRDLITGARIPLVEIPPAPPGFRFIACLTHDVDHASLRRHGWDHTTFGFLYRASVGSLINVWRGRASGRDLLANWAAAVRLPLVHLGLARDAWAEFHRYLDLDPPGRSTFYVIPFKDHPGRTLEGRAPAFRASRYSARDIAGELRRLVAAGCEIGVHGLDAWLDSARGHEELTEVARITGTAEVGVRMHWLYGDEQSPAALEKAGFAYDSTSGYNETVGYRAGTTQVFKPLDATRLLELPLHIMDTALFFPSHLGLAPGEAKARVAGLVDHAARLGGTLTVNWHDRSLAPERRWARPYADLVAAMKQANAWFATAQRAVAWFRQRRSARFESVAWDRGRMRARVAFEAGDDLPGLSLRVHPPARPCVDVAVNDRSETCVSL